MSDIIVTVPKDQVDHFWNDKVPAPEAWWTMGRRPVRLEPGDSIGFVIGGNICAAGTVEYIEQRGDGRWDIHFRDAGWIEPIPYEHFRGFRYFDLPKDTS